MVWSISFGQTDVAALSWIGVVKHGLLCRLVCPSATSWKIPLSSPVSTLSRNHSAFHTNFRHRIGNCNGRVWYQSIEACAGQLK